MDETMAYQGSESQEIGRSSDLKGKDECRESLPKEPDSDDIDPVLRSIPPFHLGVDEMRTELEIWPRKKWSLVKVYPCVDDSPHSNYGTVTTVGVCLLNLGPFKCIMVGDGGTGKTTYLKRMLTGEFEKKYEPTRGMHEHMLDMPTKQGSTQFLCIDTAGHEKPGTLREKYYKGADCCIILCDVTAKQTQKDVPMWHNDVYGVCGNIPIVVCGNKVDVETKEVTFHMKKKLKYYEISAKSGYNLDKPFQYLAKKLAGYVEGANCI